MRILGSLKAELAPEEQQQLLEEEKKEDKLAWRGNSEYFKKVLRAFMSTN